MLACPHWADIQFISPPGVRTMTRKLFCSMFVMTLAIGFVAADEFNATITKVDGDKVTYQKYLKFKKGEEKKKDGDAVTISAKGAKVAKAGKFNKEDKKF